MPAVLLAIAGNRLYVSTAICTNAVYADELLSIALRLGMHGPDNVLRVARVFMAINRSMERLRQLYDNLPQVDPSQLAHLWPNPTADPPEATQEFPKLKFRRKADRADGTALSRIDVDNERHAMYLAEMQTQASPQTIASTRIVFVKFAARYNEDAHRLLASQEPPLAPALHFCARVIGDVYMVVMDYIPMGRGWSIAPELEFLPKIPRDMTEIVERDVQKGLDLLHKRDLVFGDLREPNLLYLPEDGGRVLFVDFDRVGQHKVSRYSATLSAGAGLCRSVRRGRQMDKEHDRENLKQLVGRLRGRVKALYG
jgi:hypothetical protein